MNRMICHFERLVGMEANVSGLGDGLEFGKLSLGTDAE